MKKEYFGEINNQFLFSIYDSTKRPKKYSREKNHHHTDFEIGFIVKGSGTYILGEKTFSVTSNDLLLVRTNEMHCIPTITSENLIAFNIRISSYYLLTICTDYVEKDKIQALINSEIPIKNYFHSDRKINMYIKRIYTTFRKSDDNSRFKMRMQMVELIRAITDNITVNQSDHNISIDNINTIQKAINYIKKNYSNDISLKDIAKHIAMSPSHLSFLFKRVTGVSPYEYIITERIDKAVDLIINSDKTILQISIECGFNNLATFNKSFKKRMNVPPSSLRN